MAVEDTVFWSSTRLTSWGGLCVLGMRGRCCMFGQQWNMANSLAHITISQGRVSFLPDTTCPLCHVMSHETWMASAFSQAAHTFVWYAATNFQSKKAGRMESWVHKKQLPYFNQHHSKAYSSFFRQKNTNQTNFLICFMKKLGRQNFTWLLVFQSCAPVSTAFATVNMGYWTDMSCLLVLSLAWALSLSCWIPGDFSCTMGVIYLQNKELISKWFQLWLYKANKIAHTFEITIGTSTSQLVCSWQFFFFWLTG